MADYTTRYVFEIDVLARDVDRKAKQIARRLELALSRDITSTGKLAAQEKELTIAFEATNKAITSQTRRLSYHIRRLDDTAAHVRNLASAERELFDAMSAVGGQVFDALVASAKSAFDQIVGHSILRDLSDAVLQIYKDIQKAGGEAFETGISSARQFIEVIEALRITEAELQLEATVGARMRAALPHGAGEILAGTPRIGMAPIVAVLPSEKFPGLEGLGDPLLATQTERTFERIYKLLYAGGDELTEAAARFVESISIVGTDVAHQLDRWQGLLGLHQADPGGGEIQLRAGGRLTRRGPSEVSTFHHEVTHALLDMLSRAGREAIWNLYAKEARRLEYGAAGTPALGLTELKRVAHLVEEHLARVGAVLLPSGPTGQEALQVMLGGPMPSREEIEALRGVPPSGVLYGSATPTALLQGIEQAARAANKPLLLTGEVLEYLGGAAGESVSYIEGAAESLKLLGAGPPRALPPVPFTGFGIPVGGIAGGAAPPMLPPGPPMLPPPPPGGGPPGDYTWPIWAGPPEGGGGPEIIEAVLREPPPRGWTEWLEIFNKGLNDATLQWFGLRRLGYGLESIGRTLTRSGMGLFQTMMQLGEGYLNFEEVATRAAMAMEMQTELQDVLETKILDTSQALGLFTPEEIAEGLRLWAAGTGEVIQTEEALNDILGRTVVLEKLAAMNRENLGEVTDITGGIMDSFGLSVEDVTHIAEILNYVAAKTRATVSDVGASLKYVGAVAAQADVPLEEVAATIGVLADANLTATRVGRALTQMFIQMVKPSKAHNEAMNQALQLSGTLGDSWQDIVYPEGEFIGMAKYIDLIASATENWTTLQRSNLLATMATANELPILTTLIEKQIEARKEGTNVITDETEKLEEAHSLWDQMWRRYEESDAARAKRMRQRWDAAMKGVGKSVVEVGIPVLEVAVGLMTKMAGLFEKYPGLIVAGMTIAGINVVAGNLLTIMGKIAGVVANMMMMRGALAGFGGSVGAFKAATAVFSQAAYTFAGKATAAVGLGPAAAGAGAAGAGAGALAVAWRGLGLVALEVLVAKAVGEAIDRAMRERLEGELEALGTEEAVREEFDRLFQRTLLGGIRPRGAEGRALAEAIVGEPIGPKDFIPDEVLDELLQGVQAKLGQLPMIMKGALEETQAVAQELFPSLPEFDPLVLERQQIAVDLYTEFLEKEEELKEDHAERVKDADEAFWDWTEDAWDAYRKRWADADESFLRAGERAQEDHLLRMAQAQENFAFRQARSQADHARALSRMEEDYWEAVEEDAAGHARKIAELTQTYRDNEAKTAEDHRIRMHRLELDHLEKMSELIRTRDARGLLLEMSRYARRKGEAEEDFARAAGKRAEAYEKRKTKEEERYAEQKARRARDYEEKRQETIEDFNRAEQRRAEDFARQQAQAEEAFLRSEARAVEEYQRATERIADQFIEQWDQRQEALDDQKEQLEEELRKQLREEEEHFIDRLEEQTDYNKRSEAGFQAHYDKLLEDLRRFLARYTALWSSVFPGDTSLQPPEVGGGVIWQPKQAGGYAGRGFYTMGEAGDEFVLTAASTRAMESQFGRLSQATFGRLGRGGGRGRGPVSITLNQEHWNFSGDFSAKAKQEFRQMAYESAYEALDDVLEQVTD